MSCAWHTDVPSQTLHVNEPCCGSLLPLLSVWARGTGYGSGDKSHGQDAVWDARASEAAQRARDEELRQLLKSLASHVARDLGITGVG